MKRFRLWLMIGIATLSTLCVFFVHGHNRPLVSRLTINDLCFSPRSVPDPITGDLTIPNSIAQLDGHFVEISGDCWNPLWNGNEFDLTDFSRHPSFNPFPPKAEEFVHVKMKAGTSYSYTSNAVLVGGTIHVKVEKNGDGQITSVYRLDADWATEIPPKP
jgi:hypothetical protein